MKSSTEKPVDEMSREELRVAVASEVMGWREIDPSVMIGYGPTDTDQHSDVPDYPGDIGAAIAALGQLESDGYRWSIQRVARTSVFLFAPDGPQVAQADAPDMAMLPEAICRAALKAVRAAERTEGKNEAD